MIPIYISSLTQIYVHICVIFHPLFVFNYCQIKKYIVYVSIYKHIIKLMLESFTYKIKKIIRD